MRGTADRRPLSGRTIAVTRPPHGADDLAGRLEVLGAVPLLAPLIRIEPTGDDALAGAVAGLGSYHWVVFTSAMAVARMAAAVNAAGRHGAGSHGVMPRVAAVGPATAAAVRAQLGWHVEALPTRFTGSDLAASMRGSGTLRGARVLWPRAEDAGPAVAGSLAQAGAHLEDPVVYRTVGDTAMAAYLVGRIDEGAVDAITFTSPSAVTAFTAVAAPARAVLVAAIGPVTAAECRARGLQVDVMPEEHTIAALVDALAAELGN